MIFNNIIILSPTLPLFYTFWFNFKSLQRYIMILSWLAELINEVIDLAEIRISRYLNFVKDLEVTSVHRHFILRVVLCHLTVKPSVVAPPGLIFIYVCLCQSCAYRLPYLCLLIKPSHYFCIDETVRPGGSWRSGFEVVPMWPCELFSISRGEHEAAHSCSQLL